MGSHIKNNALKRSLKIIGWSLCGLVATLCLLFIGAILYFSDTNLAPLARRFANKHIEGRVELKDLRLAFRPGFFIVGVEMDSLTVASHAFESLSEQERGSLPPYADSLLTIDHLSGGLDLKALIFKNRISLSEVKLSGLSVNLVIARNGKANYEIASLAGADTAAATRHTPPQFSIDRFSLERPKAMRFYNAADSTSASVLLLTDAAIDGHDQPNYRLTLNGNITSPKATLATNLEQISFGLNGKVYWDPDEPGLVAMDEMEVRGEFVKVVVAGEIDFSESPIVKKGKARLMPVALTDILSLLPDSTLRHHGLYTPNFATNATLEGSFQLTAPFNLATDTIPASQASIAVRSSNLRYEKAHLSQVALDATATTLLNLPDSTKIAIERFVMQGPGTRFTASGVITKPVSDPAFDIIMAGRIDFADLPRIALGHDCGYLSGIVATDMRAAGSSSLLKPESLHQFAANGTLKARDIYYISADTSKMAQIGNADIAFSDLATSAGTPQLTASIEVDTATILISGIDLTFGNIRLGAEAPKLTSRVNIGRFNVTTLKDSAGTRINDIAGQIALTLRNDGEKIPNIAADLTTGALWAGTLTDRIAIDGANIHAGLSKLLKPLATFKSANARRKPMSAYRGFSYIPPSAVRANVKEKRSHGRRTRRVYGEIGANNEEFLVWNLNPHFKKFLNEWHLDGTVKTATANLQSRHFPIKNRFSTIDLRFSNDTLNIANIALLAGGSDLSLSGLVTNVRRALTATTDNDLKGALTLTSDTIDVNELTANAFVSPTAGHVKRRSTILLPVNLDASLKIHVDRLLYGDLAMRNVGADVLAYDGALNLTNMKATSSAGDLTFNAFYSAPTASDMRVGFDLEAKEFNIAKLAKLIPALDSITPLMHDFSGIVGADIAAKCRLKSDMDLDLTTLNAAVKIDGDNLAFIDPEKYRTLGKWLGFKDKTDNTIHSLNVAMTVDNGVLRVYPFAFNVDRYRLGVYGTNDLAMNFDYHISVLKSPLHFKFGVTIKGNPKKYKVRFGGAKFNESTAIESVYIVNKARVNLVDQIEDSFRRASRASNP